MSTPLVIVGAGGFGREALDVVDAINTSMDVEFFETVGVLDSAPSRENLERLAARGIAWLGAVEDWVPPGPGVGYVIGVGNPAARERIEETMNRSGLSAITIIHPMAHIGSQVTLGAGTVVCGGAQISTNVVLGRHVHINPSATIGHDTFVSDFASINPGAVISGEVHVGRRVLVGAGAVVLQGLRLENDSVVGASACVVSDVDAGTTVKGVPAR